MVAARPRSGSESGEAARIDLDDRDLAGRRAREQLGPPGGQRILDRPEQPRTGEERRRQRDQSGEREAEAAAPITVQGHRSAQRLVRQQPAEDAAEQAAVRTGAAAASRAAARRSAVVAARTVVAAARPAVAAAEN